MKFNRMNPPELSPPKPKRNGSNDAQRYRDRILEQLGTEYEGVERYRLDQDEKKERHWKRWGPYLSERQWVSRPMCRLFDGVPFLTLIKGHRS